MLKGKLRERLWLALRVLRARTVVYRASLWIEDERIFVTGIDGSYAHNRFENPVEFRRG